MSRSLGTVANLLPFFLVAMEAFNGSLMPYKQMPVYYRWLYWVSPFQHYVRAMLAALLHGDTVRCADYEVVSFQPPPGLECVPSHHCELLSLTLSFCSCGTYVADYLTTHPGYLLDTAESALCQFCRMSTGDDFLSTLNISFDDRWVSLAILAAYSLSNVLITYALVFYPLRTPAFIAAWVARVTGSDAVQRKGAEETASEEWAREMAYEREHPEVNASVAHDSFA